MADDNTKDAKLLELARKRFKIALEAYGETRQFELDDMRFYMGSPDNQWQWPQDILATRGSLQGQTVNARPCITVNKLPEHVNQITNDLRQNRPAAKVIPVDDKSDPEVAEILDGIVRHIDYISDADVAWDTAAEGEVIIGEGYVRILTDYADDETDAQDIKIGRIKNPFGVYMDPMHQDPCGQDAKWCFISEDMLKDDFEAAYPNAAPLSSWDNGGVGDEGMGTWIAEDTVRIAEYFYIEETDQKRVLVGDQWISEDQYKAALKINPLIPEPTKNRTAKIRKVQWCKINGFEVLERREWPGKYIPVIKVVGNEKEIEGRIHQWGIVRNAKDPQRMYNYWTSQEAEMLALAPKAPFIGYGGQFEGYENQWKNANIINYPYLEVNPDVTDQDGKVLPLPQRAPPPLAQNGLIQAKMGAADDIKSTTGQYDASLGAHSNETSGKAIMARERQSDVGTYQYRDNLARAVRYCTRQVIDLIPKIYDTKRIARIIGVDGTPDHVDLDPEQEAPVMEVRDQTGTIIKRIYNPGIGTYDVRASTGPSYMTQRQEAAEAQAQLLQGNPELWKVAGDLFVKNLDWPGAEELAERLKKIVPPELKDDAENPELAQANQRMQQMGQQMQQMQMMLERVQQSFEAQELKIKAYDAETKRIAATAANMTPEQIQDVVLGTVHGMITSGDLIGQMPAREMGILQ